MERNRKGFMTAVKKNRKGFIAVETTLFLPIFIIGLLTLIYLLKIMWIEERVFFTFEQEASRVARMAYIKNSAETAAKINENTFEIILKGKLYADHGKDIRGARFSEYKYMFSYGGLSGMICAKLNYKVDINLPVRLYKNVPIEDSLLFRAFIGADKHYAPMSFEEMKIEECSDPVWVFPRAGEKYHKESCGYIKNHPRQEVLVNAIKRKYSSCKLCKSKKLPVGSIVYCFVKSGDAYHRGACHIVDKYVLEMEKDDAIAKGYLPCMKCGG